jgi:hypothetical protein
MKFLLVFRQIHTKVVIKIFNVTHTHTHKWKCFCNDISKITRASGVVEKSVVCLSVDRRAILITVAVVFASLRNFGLL